MAINKLLKIKTGTVFFTKKKINMNEDYNVLRYNNRIRN